jgi:hypothetical protein
LALIALHRNKHAAQKPNGTIPSGHSFGSQRAKKDASLGAKVLLQKKAPLGAEFASDLHACCRA